MGKDRRLTQKQIDKLLANNPHKNPIEIAFEQIDKKQEPQAIKFSGANKEYDTLDSVEQIKAFCEFIRRVISRYDINVKQQEEAELMERDIKHCMELAPKLTEKEKKSLYSKLTDTLQARRACKTENEILQPLYDYFNDKTLLNKLAQIQGTVASIKEVAGNRIYSCRTSILDDFRNDKAP